MIENIEEYNIPNRSFSEQINYINIKPNDDINQKKHKLQLSEFNFICKKYSDFLIDLIEIHAKINDNNKNNIIVK